ncbi:ribonuclease H family protein [Evansella cellulosilytica]|uniref:Ribonuclease H n=1 Tax=Evansella cellulosilytica (strain ATCC 21833 / DSM 2522 / FERM P-1141 / JCM 9156 / N-4) TaxID=649639 RepID=E6TW92_EVAC2|nr:ribonuclease H family protein [Evansella cellulosilytica]ADU31048.1 ribonuclease H [Evansella cellulosilytica DSM 2522]
MNVRIEVTYKTVKGQITTFSSENMNVEQAILIAEDLQNTGRIKNLLFIDNEENSWTLKEVKKYTKEIETEPHNVTIYFDGGFNLEEKISGLGCAIYYEKNKKTYRLRKNELVDVLDSNNEAEYAALYFSIQQLEELGVHHLPVTIIGDSQVVINQLIGEWPCMEDVLNNWADRIESKLKQLGIRPTFTLVSRKENKEADHLATQALSEIEIESTMEIT